MAGSQNRTALESGVECATAQPASAESLNHLERILLPFFKSALLPSRPFEFPFSQLVGLAWHICSDGALEHFAFR